MTASGSSNGPETKHNVRLRGLAKILCEHKRSPVGPFEFEPHSLTKCSHFSARLIIGIYDELGYREQTTRL